MVAFCVGFYDCCYLFLVILNFNDFCVSNFGFEILEMNSLRLFNDFARTPPSPAIWSPGSPSVLTTREWRPYIPCKRFQGPSDSTRTPYRHTQPYHERLQNLQNRGSCSQTKLQNPVEKTHRTYQKRTLSKKTYSNHKIIMQDNTCSWYLPCGSTSDVISTEQQDVP